MRPRVPHKCVHSQSEAESNYPIQYTTAGLLPSQRRNAVRQRKSSPRVGPHSQSFSGSEDANESPLRSGIASSRRSKSQRTKHQLLKIVTFNIGSSSTEKLEWVLQYLAEHDVDIMCLQETKKDTYPAFIYNRGYQIHTSPCTGRSSGGMLTLVRDKWRSTQLRRSQIDTLRGEGDTC